MDEGSYKKVFLINKTQENILCVFRNLSIDDLQDPTFQIGFRQRLLSQFNICKLISETLNYQDDLPMFYISTVAEFLNIVVYHAPENVIKCFEPVLF